jgi:hypothetical protein
MGQVLNEAKSSLFSWLGDDGQWCSLKRTDVGITTWLGTSYNNAKPV